MWERSSSSRPSDSEEENGFTSEDERDIKCEILAKERDDAKEKLSRMEKASSQLLQELDVLEMQFEVERSCRETAEAFALKVTKDYKTLKRRSQALLPLIPEMPENFSITEPEPEEDDAVDPLPRSHKQIRELQSSVDRLIGEKLQLCEQVELLKKENEELKEKVMLEVGEKEAALRRLSKQSRTVDKMKRVSLLVTEEFAEMTQKLEMEQGLRQHAEVFAHQVLVKQKASPEHLQMEKRLQEALSHVTDISTSLQEIRLSYQHQLEEEEALMDLSALKMKLQVSESERTHAETQLRDAQLHAAALQDQIEQLREKLKLVEKVPSTQTDQSSEKSESPAPPLPVPPPPPPPPPAPPTSSPLRDPLKALRNRKKEEGTERNVAENVSVKEDVKARAVDEMMERIKKGIVLKPVSQSGPEDENAWKEQRNENRKSAVLELKDMLECVRRTGPRRRDSRKRISRNVGEAELQMVLQRRRRAMGDEPNPPPAAATPTEAGLRSGGEGLVTRRLTRSRENRRSRVSAQDAVIWEELSV